MDISYTFLQSIQQATILGVAGYFARNWLNSKFDNLKDEISKLSCRIDRVEGKYLECQKELPVLYATKHDVDRIETKMLQNCNALSRHSERLHAVIERVERLEHSGHGGYGKYEGHND